MLLEKIKIELARQERKVYFHRGEKPIFNIYIEHHLYRQIVADIGPADFEFVTNDMLFGHNVYRVDTHNHGWKICEEVK